MALIEIYIEVIVALFLMAVTFAFTWADETRDVVIHAISSGKIAQNNRDPICFEADGKVGREEARSKLRDVEGD